MGSKNHEVVPLSLIVQISGLRNGGVNKLVGSLAKRNLISKVQNAKCLTYWPRIPLTFTDPRSLDDGYRLTYGGYDYLAMRALSKRDSMHSVGNQIGVGKESGQTGCYFELFCLLFNFSRHLYRCRCRRKRDDIKASQVSHSLSSNNPNIWL